MYKMSHYIGIRLYALYNDVHCTVMYTYTYSEKKILLNRMESHHNIVYVDTHHTNVNAPAYRTFYRKQNGAG